MEAKRPHPLQLLVLCAAAAGLLVGVAGAWIDLHWFEQVYAVEDGPIEWATAVALLASAGIAAWTAARPAATGDRRLHALVWIGLALFCLFAAGEEVSWGQRLLGVRSPEFFLAHNAQHETNLHNLVVSGVKVNKLVFSQLMTVLAALFLVALPVLHHRNARLARWVDAAGVPVPTLLQVIAVACTFAIIGIVPSRERDELLEFGATWLFAVILLFPRNSRAIRAA